MTNTKTTLAARTRTYNAMLMLVEAGQTQTEQFARLVKKLNLLNEKLIEAGVVPGITL